MNPRAWMHPTYAVCRLAQWFYERRHPDLPWLTPQANAILASWLRPTDVAFEWGSGRSTIWLARHVAQLTSVEHDPQWFARVQPQLQGNTEYHLERDADLVHDPNSRYLGRIAAVPDASLDLCLVDGWQRADCCLAAVPKIKPGGLLVLDNAQWYLKVPYPEPSDVWNHFYGAVADWRCIRTKTGISQTYLWMREPPCE